MSVASVQSIKMQQNKIEQNYSFKRFALRQCPMDESRKKMCQSEVVKVLHDVGLFISVPFWQSMMYNIRNSVNKDELVEWLLIVKRIDSYAYECRYWFVKEMRIPFLFDLMNELASNAPLDTFPVFSGSYFCTLLRKCEWDDFINVDADKDAIKYYRSLSNIDWISMKLGEKVCWNMPSMKGTYLINISSNYTRVGFIERMIEDLAKYYGAGLFRTNSGDRLYLSFCRTVEQKYYGDEPINYFEIPELDVMDYEYVNRCRLEFSFDSFARSKDVCHQIGLVLWPNYRDVYHHAKKGKLEETSKKQKKNNKQVISTQLSTFNYRNTYEAFGNKVGLVAAVIGSKHDIDAILCDEIPFVGHCGDCIHCGAKTNVIITSPNVTDPFGEMCGSCLQKLVRRFSVGQISRHSGAYNNLFRYIENMEDIGLQVGDIRPWSPSNSVVRAAIVSECSLSFDYGHIREAVFCHSDDSLVIAGLMRVLFRLDVIGSGFVWVVAKDCSHETITLTPIIDDKK